MIPLPLELAAQAMGAQMPGGGAGVAAVGIATDSRQVRPGEVFFALRGERDDGHRFVGAAARAGAAACVVSREWAQTQRDNESVTLLSVDDPVSALGRLAAFYRREVLPAGTVIVGVTGSNGKTTTKDMIHHVLCRSMRGKASPKSFNNQLGVPLTLLSADAEDRYLIVEIGSNAPGEIATLAEIASPGAGVITSIGPAHLEGLGSVADVAAEKASLLRHIRPGGLAAVNVDSFEIRRHLWATRGLMYLCYGFDGWAERRIVPLESNLSGTTFALEGRYRIQLSIPGLHHAGNAAAAFYISRWLGVAPEDIVSRLAEFAATEGRTRAVEVDGVRVIDDAYNANPASMTAAIRTLERSAGQRRIFVMGDMFELGPESRTLHLSVAREAVRTGIEVLVAVGPASSDAAGAASGEANGATRILACEDADAASSSLDGLLRPGDVVWVKGSRRMQLDRIVQHLTDRARRGVASVARG